MSSLLNITSIESFTMTAIYALHGLSLQVKEKEVFAGLGPNGAGKTTLLRPLQDFSKTSPRREQ